MVRADFLSRGQQLLVARLIAEAVAVLVHERRDVREPGRDLLQGDHVRPGCLLLLRGRGSGAVAGDAHDGVVRAQPPDFGRQRLAVYARAVDADAEQLRPVRLADMVTLHAEALLG